MVIYRKRLKLEIYLLYITSGKSHAQDVLIGNIGNDLRWPWATDIQSGVKWCFALLIPLTWRHDTCTQLWRRRLNKPGTHWRQCRSTVAKIGDKSATKSTVDFVTDLSPVCRKSTVAGSFDFVDRVAVVIVAKVERVQVQLGRLCRKWVTFVAGMSNVLSTLSQVCTAL